MSGRVNSKTWLIMTLFLLGMAGTSFGGKIIYVDADANGLNNGSSWKDAYKYLQYVLADANSVEKPVEIRVAQGIYKPDQGKGVTLGDRMASFQLINGVTIKGGYAGFGEPDPNAWNIEVYKTILSGDLNGDDEPNFAKNGENSYHVVTSNETDETAVLDGFTITAGNADGGNTGQEDYTFGGGMCNFSGSLKLTNCTFERNSAAQIGGGISNISGTPTLTNCIFIRNLACGGGGMYNYGDSILTDCKFIENSASGESSMGGAIFTQFSSPTLLNCSFVNNIAGESSVESSAYQGGGAIYAVDGGNPKLINCTFIKNSAQYYGGAINSIWGDTCVTINNCTFSGNRAAAVGGICNQEFSNAIVINSILWENYDKGGMGEWAQVGGGSPVVNYCCIQGWTGRLGGVGNIGEDPLLAPDGCHLLVGSSCVNAGDPAFDYTGQIDIDCEPRVMLGRVDIGADETDGRSHLIVLAPIDGEVLISGKVYIIRWQIPEGVGDVLIEYSIDGGLSWIKVEPPNTGNSGSYNWLVPVADSKQCLVRISDANNPILSATSYGVFRIIPAEGNRRMVPEQFATIQAAIDECCDGDMVIIAPGTYSGNGNRDIDFRGKAVVVRSIDPNNPDIVTSTIIDCKATEEEPHRGFYFHHWEGENSVISGLTITNGFTKGPGTLGNDGGGILCEASSPTIRNCVIEKNIAYGIGGGIACIRSSNSNIYNCVLSSNKAYSGHGGGIMCAGSSPAIVGCKIVKNWSDQWGGGISCCWGSSSTIRNCFISSNFARGQGGGVFCSEGSPQIMNCTVTENLANDGAAALRIWDCDSSVVYGSILRGTILVTGSSVSISYSNIQDGWEGKGNIDVDPLLAPDGYHLLSGSPCINAGNPNYVAEPNETDMDGEQRVMLGRVDMGADEFNPFEVTFDVVGRRRISRTVFEYDCNVTLTNISRFAVRNVQLEIVKASENMVIIDPNVEFGDIEIGPGESAISIDTCTFQVDRSEAIEPAKIIWKSICAIAASGQEIQDTALGMGFLWLENNTGDSKVDFEDLAALAGQWLWVGSAGSIPEDITGDGIVNLRDFAELAATSR